MLSAAHATIVHVADANPVERALSDLQLVLRRHGGAESAAGEGVRSGAIPEDLATDEAKWLSLNADEEAAVQSAVEVLANDLSFEHITDANQQLWRFMCGVAMNREENLVAKFVAENRREPMETVCYFPIEFLAVDQTAEVLGVRLLPPAHEDVPPEERGFALNAPVGSVAAVPIVGTNYKLMKERAAVVLDRALRILRTALRFERGMPDLQLRFRRGEGYSFGGRLVGWERRPEIGVTLTLDNGLIENVSRQRVAGLTGLPSNDLERRADRALRWLEDATLATDPVEELLFLCFALEALLGRKGEGLKAKGLAFRRALLGQVVRGHFAHPLRAVWLYEDVRSAAVHGDDPPEIPHRQLLAFGADVREALSEYLDLAANERLETRRALLRFLESHADRQLLATRLAEEDPIWRDLLDRGKGGAGIVEVFPPDDRVALFVESMTQAANDIEFALRQAGRANPEGALPEVPVRRRLGFWFRLVNGFLFEALVALRAWEQEPEARELLDALSPDAYALLKQVRRLREQLGGTAIEAVRQQTFHYPHPHSGKRPDSTEALAEVLRSATGITAALDLREESDHTFIYADQIALGLSMAGHFKAGDARLDGQMVTIRDGAAAFVNLVKHLYLAYCERKNIAFERIEHP